MSDKNVVTLAASRDAKVLSAPKHFRAPQRAAWDDLCESAPVEASKPANRFTLEIAATLMAKFRSGKAMTATETKELKRQLVVLGLAAADDDGAKKKPRKNSRYFGGE